VTRRLTAAILILSATGACADASAPSDGGGSVEGTTWILDASSAAALGEDPGDARATIRFEDGEVGGQAFCNHFGGTYEIAGDSMTIEVGAMTEMACEEPLMTLELAFVAALGQVTSVTAGDDRLTLIGGDVELAFDAEQPVELIGMEWRLDGLASGDAVHSTIAGTEATLTLSEDGAASGNASCNSFSGGYELDGTSLSFGALATTRMACSDPPGVMEQEAEFLGALEATRSFGIEGASLFLLDANGSLLATLVSG
jgi:heat shock protein HslJ